MYKMPNDAIGDNSYDFEYEKILPAEEWWIERQKEIINLNKDNLFDTMKSMGDEDFFMYAPIELIERSLMNNIEDKDIWKYLINFRDNIFYIRQQKKESNRTQLAYIEANKKKYWDSNDQYYKAVRSEKKLQQTPIMFQEECDKAMIACWFDPETLMEEYWEIRDSWKRNIDIILWNILSEEEKETELSNIENRVNDFRKKILPIYVYLRKQWYTHSDLIR